MNNCILHYYVFDNKYYKLAVFETYKMSFIYGHNHIWHPIKNDVYIFEIPDILNMKYDVKFHHMINNESHFCILEFEKLVYKQLLE